MYKHILLYMHTSTYDVYIYMIARLYFGPFLVTGDFATILSMEFHERNIQMFMDRQCPTDCLIIKGYYSAITLAIYGQVMKDIPPHLQPTAQQPHSQPVASHVAKIEGWYQLILSQLYICIYY